ncbi:uncharacterized protein LOC113226413 [Hyposmocoma kahamanoa]|uniref:uncharacterized protein LOC113226413 n=1 Tax=Hyposmocoma kahamanoa TaxID=1477025 RepID=UPI000E6D9DEF|nr:uncharacterized protein LOC113226413 [Hyposmocoma kahamanoa]
MACCKALPLPLSQLKGVPIEECLDEMRKSPKPASDGNCELEQCIGYKMGYVTEDGTFIKSAIEPFIADAFGKRPGLVENIKKNCINADVKDYGFDHFCELKKFDQCLLIQYAMSCPEFDNRGRCSEIKSLAEKCYAE